jgi:serine/threonine protein kinase
VARLKKLLAALIKGQGSFEAVSAALEQTLAESPEKAPQVAKLLRAARDAGLPNHVYAALNGSIAISAQKGGSDATVLAADNDVANADRTVLATDADVADADKTVLASDGADPDKTVVAGERDADATVVDPRVDASETTRRKAESADFREAPTEVDAAAGDATEVRPAAGADDATEVQAAARGDADATVVNAGADGATTATSVTADPDKTVVAGDGDGDGFDILSDEAITAAERAAEVKTGTSMPTSAAATVTEGAGVTREFRENDRLRNRFQLISKLGEGGMGAVWKGKDLLKEEARDRNPFVAIKLLQGDFKEHPEAFIALQRETAKQQRLAHPNVATVYDFDRDDTTNTVFMTMEVLEGQPLDSYIRKLPAGGLDPEEAMPLIEQLCNGLAYAHSHGLVHSDLKPGNCFYTKDGNIKLLDFGIARASKTKGDAEGETTLFDPGQLGALTPTYATIEMFEGEDPDQRDDIYALAIMSYQLLTGKHPYGKKSAPKAKELGLKPEPVPKLNKRQNRGLMRGLEFKRDNRTPTVLEFFEDIRPKKSRTPMFIGAGIAATVIIGALSYQPIMNFVEEKQREEIIAVIQQPGLANIRSGLEQARGLENEQQLNLILSDPRTVEAVVTNLAAGGEKTINETLAFMKQYPPKWQSEVLNEDRAKESIFKLYETKIDETFNVKQERYEYAVAQAHLEELKAIYPDSAPVLLIEQGLKAEKEKKLAELNDDYSRFLDEGRLLPVASERDINDVIATVRQIDPEYHLLTDDRLRFRYGELAEQAIGEKDYARADALLKASTAYAANDAKLNDLRFQVQSELQRIANEKRVAEIEQRLGPRLSALNSLADFQAVRDDLVVLADLSPESKLLTQAQGTLKQAFGAQLDKDVAAQAWPEGEKLLVDFSKLFDIAYLTEQRRLLSGAEQSAGYSAEMTPERRAAVDERLKTIDELLANPEFSSDWEIKLKVPYKELIALLPQGDQTFEKVRNQTARLYLEKAKSALESERFVEALAFVDSGRVFYPGLKNFNDFEAAIAQAQEAWRKRRQEEQRLARIEALKKQFTAAAERNDVQDADQKIASLKAEGMAADDPFLVNEAPRVLANAYLRLAQGRVENEAQQDFEQALALSRKGLELAPDLKPLQDAVKTYEAEVRKRELEIAMRKTFDSTDNLDVAAARSNLEKLKNDLPNRYAGLRQEFADARGNRIRGMANDKDLKIDDIQARLSEYKSIFPNEAGKVQNDVADIIGKRIRSVKVASAGDLEVIAGAVRGLGKVSPQAYASLSKEMTEEIAGRVRALEKTDKAAAVQLLAYAKDVFGEAQAFSGITIVLPCQPCIAGLNNVRQGKLVAATASLQEAKAKNSGHPELASFEQALQNAMNAARAKYEEYAALASQKQPKSRHKGIQDIRAQALALCSDCSQFKEINIEEPRRGECNEGLAGFGKRRAGECWDLVGRAKGPVLVVVPPGNGVAKPFAISKYEISGNDFNDFCKATKACNRLPRSKAKLPVTGISLQQAEAFAKWLSEEASKTENRPVVYRLPTEAEWEHAAKADGSEPEKKYNCRVTSGGNVIAGHALIDSTSGQQNAWGLANYVGNAQEWVKAGGSVKARGGAFEDPLTKCDVSISRSHSGQPDEVTGFRLVREMG